MLVYCECFTVFDIFWPCSFCWILTTLWTMDTVSFVSSPHSAISSSARSLPWVMFCGLLVLRPALAMPMAKQQVDQRQCHSLCDFGPKLHWSRWSPAPKSGSDRRLDVGRQYSTQVEWCLDHSTFHRWEVSSTWFTIWWIPGECHL